MKERNAALGISGRNERPRDPLGTVPGSLVLMAAAGFGASHGLRDEMDRLRLPSVLPAMVGAAGVVAVGEFFEISGYWPFALGLAAGGAIYLGFEALGVVRPTAPTPPRP